MMTWRAADYWQCSWTFSNTGICTTQTGGFFLNPVPPWPPPLSKLSHKKPPGFKASCLHVLRNGESNGCWSNFSRQLEDLPLYHLHQSGCVEAWNYPFVLVRAIGRMCSMHCFRDPGQWLVMASLTPSRKNLRIDGRLWETWSNEETQEWFSTRCSTTPGDIWQCVETSSVITAIKRC